MFKDFFLQETTLATKNKTLLGEFIHSVFYFLPELKAKPENVDKAILKAWALFKKKESLLSFYGYENLEGLLKGKNIQEKFLTILKKIEDLNLDYQKDLKEQEIIDEKGQIYRLDRVLIGSKIIILELKLSNSLEKKENYLAQVNLYKYLLQKIFSQPICAYLIYFKEQELEKIL